MEPVPPQVAIAHLTRPRGIHGELRAIPLTDRPERYQSLNTVWVSGAEYTVERVWYHGDQPIFKFQGIDTIDGAERLAGQDVYVPGSERLPRAGDEFYYDDLIGCRVLDAASGQAIGIVTGWQESGGPVLLELESGRILIPFAKALLPEIDLESREIRAMLPDGLLNLNP